MSKRIERWTADQVAEGAGGTWFRGESGDGPDDKSGDVHWGAPEAPINAVETDTRKLAEGSLFVALRGERFDGHDFLDAALQAGAAAALVEAPDDSIALPQLVVDDTLVALQRLGHAVWAEATAEGLHSVALTGSNGKTTTKEFLAALFRTLGPTHHTPGNFNNHIGVPLTLCALPGDAAFAVIEMGANDFGDIRELIAIAPAAQRVLVSIGAAHLEKLGDLDGVRRVKSEIFEHADGDTIAIIPTAHEKGLHLDDFGGTIYRVGEGGDLEFGRAGSDVELRWSGGQARVELPYRGEHNAANFALAAATLVSGGFDFDPAAAAHELSRLTLPGGRLRRVEAGARTFVDDAYNANPTSVLASYDAFLEIAELEMGVGESDRVVVVGEMLELGDAAAKMHATVARRLAERGGAGRFVWVGAFAHQMWEAARHAPGVHVEAESVEDAAAAIPERGLIFLKASRGQRLERIIDLVGSS